MALLHAFITNKGGAKALAQELTELGLKPAEKGADWCEAQATPEQLRHIHLRSQTAHRVLELLHHVESREKLQEAAKGVKPRDGTFCVRANGVDRQEIEEEIGGLIKEATGSPVKLTKPDTQYYVHDADGSYLLGIDIFGDLAKRHYKIMTGSQSLTGPLATCALRLAGWTPKHDLVVWPCATGELAIEAALWASEKSPRAYELGVRDEKKPKCTIIAADPKLAMIRSVEKNAKVAGVLHFIRCSRQDADWLDTKHEEGSLKHVVGLLPNLALQPKLAAEIFYQLDFILKKKATAAFLCVNDESAQRLEAAAKNYELRREYLWSGKHAYALVLCTKQ